MLRKLGYTPAQLRSAYEEAAQKPYGEIDLVQLFGKPPYEFLGEAFLNAQQQQVRTYPNYSDFSVQFVDDIGREYQPTDDASTFFVRIPISKTRRSNSATYEQYVGFPTAGESVNLTGATEEIHARVQDCPYDQRRAVSTIYLETITRVTFVPDLIDSRGRMYMRCVRNDASCPLAADVFEQEKQEKKIGAVNDDALYYVRLPTACICTPTFSSDSAALITPRVIASVYTQASEPYLAKFKKRFARGELDRIAVNIADRFLDFSSLTNSKKTTDEFEKNSDFPACGERFLAYHLYGQQYAEFRVKGSTEFSSDNVCQSPKSSCFVTLHMRKLHNVPFESPSSVSNPAKISAQKLAASIYKPPSKVRKTLAAAAAAAVATSSSAQLQLQLQLQQQQQQQKQQQQQQLQQRLMCTDEDDEMGVKVKSDASPSFPQQPIQPTDVYDQYSLSTSASVSEIDERERTEKTRELANRFLFNSNNMK